jgi:hypothetical protein
MSLSDRYTKLAGEGNRDVFLERARRGTKLTIPTLYPPDGKSASTSYPTPWQSLGARCVNNLAAKLLLALFPPSAPFFRLVIDDFTLEKMTGAPGMRGEVEKALNKIERAVSMEIETTTSRPALFEGLKLLIVGGNTLLVVGTNNRIKTYRLDSYVVKRDPEGNPLEMILKECLSPMELTPEVRALCRKDGEQNEDDCDLYTCWQKQDSGVWKVWQEIDKIRVPGEQTYPEDKCPALPLRWTSITGEDYGRGMVEEFIGDFLSLEGLQKAIVQGAAAAAKVLFLVKPNSTTKKDTLAKAESGAIESGNAEDVTVLQMEKYGDFRVAQETRAEITQALSFAFMLNSSIQRNGERVTAEEIRFMAQELESGLGGVYSTLSQDLQLPLVNQLQFNMERDQRLPALPKGVVKPAITTGIEAIGRGNDLTRLSGLLVDLAPLGPSALEYINMGDLIKRVGTARQIDMEGLIKSEDEVAQARQQAQMMALAEKAAPNVVNQVGAAMAPQQQ